jgi:uncharacterized SAM-binding protein YcdF (DUF218 family)
MPRILWSLGLILLLPLLAAVAFMVEIALYSTRSDPDPADAAIVLGAAAYRGAPSPVFEERIRHAVALYRAGRVRRIVTTGGLSPGERLSEAEVAHDWSVAQGVPTGDILMESQSRTTQENLAFAAPLLAGAGIRRVLIVSDPLHMRRALAHARHLGFDAYPSPTPSTRYVGWESRGRFLVRETYFLARCRLVRAC